MDKISGFSDDELLVKILSFLPTKVAVSTSVLSKQWKFLWMRVPKLEYNDFSIYVECRTNSVLLEKSERMRDFIDRNLRLHSSPVIESLCLSFVTLPFQPEYIKLWVEIAVSRRVRELSVDFLPSRKRNALLPTSLYTCKSLVTLKLRYGILVDVPHVFCLPSLKTLHLERVTYADEESLQRLLSNCSVLEDLSVERWQGDNLRKFAIIIPSLLSLSFFITSQCFSDGYVIDTPSLKYFKATDLSNSPCLIVNMPKLEEATIFAVHNIKKLLEPATSVKRLSLYIRGTSAEAVYGDEIVFKELEHLKFIIIQMTYWSKSLFWLLNASPKLRDLNISEHVRDGRDTMVFWKQLTSVPQCLLSTLQTFTWSGHSVSVEGKDLATYILRKSCRLKTARISIGSGLDPQKKHEMETEVKFSSRGSPTCNLIFS